MKRHFDLSEVLTKLKMKLNNKTILKFSISFTVVLYIPVLVFYLLYNQTFLTRYKNKIIDQSINEISQIQQYLDNQFTSMYAISMRFGLQKHMSSAYIRDNFTAYTNIKEALSSTVSTQPFFASVSFYSAASPNVVYTDSGTYNPEFYNHYLSKSGESRAIDEALQDISGITWIMPDAIRLPFSSKRNVNTELIIPTQSNSYVIFRIPQENFEVWPNKEGVKTIIFTGDYEQLYPYEAADMSVIDTIKSNLSNDKPYTIQDDYYLFSDRSNVTGLIVAQIIPDDVMSMDLINLQKIYITAITCLCLGGSLLIILMTFINYRPIKVLANLAKEKMQDMPVDIKDTEAAAYAITQLGTKNEMLEKAALKTLREKIILKIVHGKITNTDELINEMNQAGFAFRKAYLRVVLMSVKIGTSQDLDFLSGITSAISDNYEVEGMEYVKNESYLLIIGCDNNDYRELKERFEHVLMGIENEINGTISISIGGAVNQLCHLCHSFNQAALCSKSDGEDIVTIYDNAYTSDDEFIYPALDIKTLHNTIITADVNKFNIIMDILIETVHRYKKNNNMIQALLLCFDIIITILHALDKIGPQTGINNVGKIMFNIFEYADLEVVLKGVADLRGETEKLIHANQKSDSSDKLSKKLEQFISENCNSPELCVSFVAKHFDMSVSNLSHQFKAQTGLNISDFIAEKKIAYAKDLLLKTDLTISDIASHLGYTQTSSFIRKFKQYEKITPNEYRILYQGTAV